MGNVTVLRHAAGPHFPVGGTRRGLDSRLISLLGARQVPRCRHVDFRFENDQVTMTPHSFGLERSSLMRTAEAVMRLRDYNRYAGRLADKGLFQENYRDFMTSWSKMLFDVSATCVVATGLSNILQGGVNVFAATHTSNLIEYAALFPLLHFGDYTFLAKAKLRDSALIGNIVSHSDRTIFVQRGNPESHQGTLDAMTDTLMEGRNLLLNPSGTRAYGRMQRSTSRWPRFQRQDGDIFRRPLKWGLAKAVLRAVHQGIDVNVIPVILNGAGLVSAVGSSVWGHLMHMPIQGNQTIDLHFASGLSVNRASLDPTDDEANEARIMDHVEDAFRRHYRAPVTARNALVA